MSHPSHAERFRYDDEKATRRWNARFNLEKAKAALAKNIYEEVDQLHPTDQLMASFKSLGVPGVQAAIKVLEFKSRLYYEAALEQWKIVDAAGLPEAEELKETLNLMKKY
jgi:ABC-type transport system substrate-binding protein